MLGCRTGRRYQITSNVLSGTTLHTGWDTEVAATRDGITGRGRTGRGRPTVRTAAGTRVDSQGAVAR